MTEHYCPTCGRPRSDHTDGPCVPEVADLLAAADALNAAKKKRVDDVRATKRSAANGDPSAPEPAPMRPHSDG